MCSDLAQTETGFACCSFGLFVMKTESIRPRALRQEIITIQLQIGVLPTR